MGKFWVAKLQPIIRSLSRFPAVCLNKCEDVWTVLWVFQLLVTEARNKLRRSSLTFPNFLCLHTYTSPFKIHTL